jgi:hypothetical protein
LVRGPFKLGFAIPIGASAVFLAATDADQLSLSCEVGLGIADINWLLASSALDVHHLCAHNSTWIIFLGAPSLFLAMTIGAGSQKLEDFAQFLRNA